MHFWGLTHECRGRVEVHLQEIAERLFGAGGGTLVHTHFSKTQNSNYCRLLRSHAPARAVSVPGSPALCVWCCRWCCGRGAYHGAAAGLGCWVLPAAWRAQFPCARIGCIPHEVQGHMRTRAGHAAYALAPTHKPRVVGSCDSQLVVLRFTRNAAQWRLHQHHYETQDEHHTPHQRPRLQD